MYIIKNALRYIDRSKGRNILIGIIALVIAVSACICLSIRQASESAKESDVEKRAILLSYMLPTLKTDRNSSLSDRPALPLVA